MKTKDEIQQIADKADMIVNGYSFTNKNGWIHVLNLNCAAKEIHSAVIYNDKIAETNMDDIEISIVMDYYNKNKNLLELDKVS